MPPSKDKNRPKPNQSLRKPSGKKPGGQKGRKGKTLEMTATPDKKYKELFTFYTRMGRERQSLFTFFFIKEVPPDNNASERAIRNVKVKQKISGQFKTERTAQNFAKIRSVIDS